MALEVLDAMKHLGEGLVFKIDFKKAYDSVDRDFLWFVLLKMGLGSGGSGGSRDM